MQCCRPASDKQKDSITLLILGLDDSGKTTVLNYLLKNENRNAGNVVPTVGLTVSKFKYRTRTLINVYDFGGRAEIRCIWEQYFHEADGIVYVIDCSNKERFEESKSELLKILKHPEIEQKPILVLANKVDENPYYEDCDFIEDLEIEDLVNELRCPTFVRECSALKDPIDRKHCTYAISQAFAWLVNVVRYREHEVLDAFVNGDCDDSRSPNGSTSRLLDQPAISKWKRYFCRRNKTAPDCFESTTPTAAAAAAAAIFRRNSSTDWAFVN